MKNTQLIALWLILVTISAVWFALIFGTAQANNEAPGPVVMASKAPQEAPPTRQNKYFIYYDATGQIMAKTSSRNAPQTTSWEQQGMTRVSVTKQMWKALSRDHYVTVDGGQLVSYGPRVNPVILNTPTIDYSRAAIESRILTGTYTSKDVVEYLRILGDF